MKQVTRRMPKVDGLGLLLGRPIYTDDLAPNNSLIIKILRSPHAFAKIKSINTEVAKKVPGVECILTHEDVPKVRFTRAGQPYPETSPQDTYILDKYVRFIGDDVAIIAATSEEIADKAIKLINVDYDILEPILDFEKAEKSSNLVHLENDCKCLVDVGYDPSNNVVCKINFDYGDIDKALEESDVVIEGTYHTQSTHQSFLETFRTSTYIDQYERLVVISSTQVPFHVKKSLSKSLKIPMRKIRVIKPRIGGGYGGKHTLNAEYYPAIVTLKTGKPAKIVYSREESFESGTPRVPMKIKIKLGASKNGLIKAIDLKVLGNSGAYGEHINFILSSTALKVINLYNKVNAARYTGTGVYTNTVPTGSFRGFGATQGIYALESAVNELSHKLNIDPTLIREINMIREDENIIKFNVDGVENKDFQEFTQSCKLDYCIKKGKKLIGWTEKYPRKQISSTRFRGVGMAIARQGSGSSSQDTASATINFNEDGSFMLFIGTTDLGTGSDTVLAQICAEAIGVQTETITVLSSDTDFTSFDTGSYTPSTIYASGNAAKKAGEKMRELIINEAATILDIDPSSVIFDGDKILVKNSDKETTLKALGKKLICSLRPLFVCESYTGHKSPPPYMAGFVEVEVDTSTGKVSVENFVGVFDIGTVINPSLARIQAEGGILQGIGMALYEDIKMSSKGKMLTNNFMNYTIPSRNDIGNITIDFAESYEKTGPYGAKSAGEIGLNSSCPAIQDAIYNAVGVRIKNLPITPEKVLMALKNKC